MILRTICFLSVYHFWPVRQQDRCVLLARGMAWHLKQWEWQTAFDRQVTVVKAIKEWGSNRSISINTEGAQAATEAISAWKERQDEKRTPACRGYSDTSQGAAINAWQTTTNVQEAIRTWSKGKGAAISAWNQGQEWKIIVSL